MKQEEMEKADPGYSYLFTNKSYWTLTTLKIFKIADHQSFLCSSGKTSELNDMRKNALMMKFLLSQC